MPLLRLGGRLIREPGSAPFLGTNKGGISRRRPQSNGVAVGRVGRQEEQLDPVAAGFEPVSHLVGFVDLEIVDDQEELTACRLDQALEKREEQVGVQGTLVDHEPCRATIGDGRDHAGGVTHRCLFDHRRPTFGREAAAVMGLVRDAGLIAPMDGSIFRLGALGNCRVVLPQPLLDLGILALDRPLDRSLRGKSPATGTTSIRVRPRSEHGFDRGATWIRARLGSRCEYHQEASPPGMTPAVHVYLTPGLHHPAHAIVGIRPPAKLIGAARVPPYHVSRWWQRRVNGLLRQRRAAGSPWRSPIRGSDRVSLTKPVDK